jgi:hypothetical protein
MLKKLDRLAKPNVGYSENSQAGDGTIVEDLLSACSLRASDERDGQRSVDSGNIVVAESTDCKLPLELGKWFYLSLVRVEFEYTDDSQRTCGLWFACKCRQLELGRETMNLHKIGMLLMPMDVMSQRFLIACPAGSMPSMFMLFVVLTYLADLFPMLDLLPVFWTWKVTLGICKLSFAG